MKIGILQAGLVREPLRQRHGQFSNMFERFLGGRGFEFETWSVVEDEFPHEPRDADGWLVTGSRHAVYEDLPWIRRLEEFLRLCYAASVPIVGLCFGHQVLATALGGKVKKTAEGWGIGRHRYETANGPVHLIAWHQDQVTEPPADAKVFGSSPFCKFAMLVYRDQALSMQPHPEFEHPFLRDLIEMPANGIEPELIEKAKTDFGKSLDSEQISEKISRFFLDFRKADVASVS